VWRGVETEEGYKAYIRQGSTVGYTVGAVVDDAMDLAQRKLLR